MKMEKNESKKSADSLCLINESTRLENAVEMVETTNSKCSIVTKSVNLDEAIEIVGFGKFHHYLLFICGAFFGTVAISITSVSFVVPAAQCDLKMSSVHKGLLNGISMIGMLFGSLIWGYVADSKGRKHAIILSMMLDGLFSIISSVTQIYPLLMFCRLMSGFGSAGVNVLYSYLGEFLNTKYREKYLCCMEIFWTIGVITLPCIAWLIIPLTFRIESGFFLFRSWNLFIIICASPSILLSCLLLRLPESPKFLFSKGQYDETMECLKFVYRWNNKNDDQFPVTSIMLPDHINKSSKGFFKGLYDSFINCFTSKFKVVFIITCFMHFFVTSSFYMLVLWFPELMNRFRWYETIYTGPKNHETMCEIVSLFKFEPEKTDNFICDDHINQSVYINIAIIGIACIPTSIIVPFIVNKLGLRLLLVLNFVGAGVSAALLYFITSSIENLVLSSVFEAFSSSGYSLIFCIGVELFPTEYRSMAVSIGSMFGKLGGLLGNVVVGVFIDAHCLVPILVSCSFLMISGLLVLLLPKTRRTDIK